MQFKKATLQLVKYLTIYFMITIITIFVLNSNNLLECNLSA